MIALHIYKYYSLIYPPKIWTMELLGLIMLGATQAVRIHIGIEANRSEGAKENFIFLLLTIPVLITITYYTTLVTYVLTIEILLSVVPLVLFSWLEIVYSVCAARSFSK